MYRDHDQEASDPACQIVELLPVLDTILPRLRGSYWKRLSSGGESPRLSVTGSVGITNLFNRVNYGQFGGVLGSAYFGIPSGSGPARQMDFNLRFIF